MFSLMSLTLIIHRAPFSMSKCVSHTYRDVFHMYFVLTKIQAEQGQGKIEKKTECMFLRVYPPWTCFEGYYHSFRLHSVLYGDLKND